MNILITGCKDYPAFSSKTIISGGMEVMVTEYAENLPEGYRFTILPGRRGLPKFEENEKATVYRLPILGSTRLQPFSLCVGSIFKAIALHKKIDFCLPQSPLAGLPALGLKILFGTPYIVYTHSFNAEVSHVGNRFFVFLYRTVEKITFRLADALITAGEELKEYIVKNYGMPGEKLAVIHSGINMPDEKPVDHSAFEQYGVTPDDFVVLYLGRLIEENGIFDLLDAVLMLRDRGKTVKCLLAGNGDLEDSLRRKIQETGSGDLIKLVGIIRGELKDNMIRRCNLMARTSYHEAFPVIYLEAFSYGKPVLATPAGDTAIIARDSQAVSLVDMHRPDQAAEKIEELLDNPELCREMGSRGVKYAVQNSWPLQSSKLVALIEKILCQK